MRQESNVDGLIAEIKSDLSKYADVGLLDEGTMYREIVLGIKRFGNDITDLHETVVEVIDGYAELPENFKTLYAAYLCEPAGFFRNPEIEEHELQNSHFYTERTTYGEKWNECDPSCVEKTENIIKENFFFKKKKAAQFYYKRQPLLTLGKAFHKNNCHSKCRNRYVVDNPNEIVIIDFRLQANFNKGDIYMMYYGLPMDSEGKIEIPNTKLGHLESYLEYRVKRKLAENLIANRDAIGLQAVYPIYAEQERIHLKEASNEFKMSKISPRTMRRWQRLNQQESFQYESLLTRK